MSQNTQNDGDLTLNNAPKLNRNQISSESVQGIEVAGQEFKLSDVLKDDAPVFNNLSAPEEPSVHTFDNFDVCEMPGSNESKATFALKCKVNGLNDSMLSKTKELFGVDVEDVSDLSQNFPFIIQVTEEIVLSRVLDIFKTLDSHLEEAKKGL